MGEVERMEVVEVEVVEEVEEREMDVGLEVETEEVSTITALGVVDPSSVDDEDASASVAVATAVVGGAGLSSVDGRMTLTL